MTTAHKIILWLTGGGNSGDGNSVSSIPANVITTEGGNPIITESGDYLVTE